MTAPRITTLVTLIEVGDGRLRAETGMGERVIADATPDEERAYAPLLFVDNGVRITIEPTPAPPEPLTGGDGDINVRVRIRRDWVAGSFLAGKTGVLAEYAVDDHAVVRLDDGHFYNIPVVRLERAPAECPHCGKAAP